MRMQHMKIPHHLVAAGALLLAGVIVGCHGENGSSSPATQSSSASAVAPGATTQPFAEQNFDTPEQAAATLKQAVDMQDTAELSAIFGSEGTQLIFTGDAVQEKNRLESFAMHMGEQLRVDQSDPEKATLFIGASNWPFPIPLVKSGSQWHFDTDAGKEEIINRRIGHNEFSAIDVCRAFVRAEKEYASKPRTDDRVIQYARKFGSTPGKHDGLYWEPESADDFSPMGSLLASAEAEGYGSEPVKHRQPYHGFIFHILTAQGPAAPGGAKDYLTDGRLTKGFALIAYPSEYGSSGVMTFIVNQDGKVYQKNLGPDTKTKALAIKEYNPDSSWQEVKEQ